MPVFYRLGTFARIFPLHLPVVLERRRFWGGVSELEGHLPVLSGILWSTGCSGGCVSALGRPLACAESLARRWQVSFNEAGRRRSASAVCQRAAVAQCLA